MKPNTSLLTVEQHYYNDHKFLCDCFDPSQPESDVEHTVTEAELEKALNAASLNYIPIIVNAGEIDEIRFSGTLEQWQEHNDLNNVLALVINKREGRIEKLLQRRPISPADFKSNRASEVLSQHQTA